MSASIYNRAEAVDKNFVKFVKEGHLPPPRSSTGLAEAGLSPAEFMDLFETQMMSRQMDLRARILKNQNECFYTIGSSGHEGNAGATLDQLLGDGEANAGRRAGHQRDLTAQIRHQPVFQSCAKRAPMRCARP